METESGCSVTAMEEYKQTVTKNDLQCFMGKTTTDGLCLATATIRQSYLLQPSQGPRAQQRTPEELQFATQRPIQLNGSLTRRIVKKLEMRKWKRRPLSKHLRTQYVHLKKYKNF